VAATGRTEEPPGEDIVSEALAPRHLKAYVIRRLRLGSYLVSPGDGRKKPQIPASSLLWAHLIGVILRECSFHAIEALVRSPLRRALRVTRRFGDDALGYFTERLDPSPTRKALIQALRRAKRNKAFDGSRFIGLAVDGTGAARSERVHCSLCSPLIVGGTPHGHGHRFSLLTVVGTGLSLPFDVEPYGPQESETGASKTLLTRAIVALGRRFADYLVADAEYASAPFLRVVSEMGLKCVIRLKDNLPNLHKAAQGRFALMDPTATFDDHGDSIEVWDKDDFDPWEGLPWKAVRVVRYRQHKSNGTIIEAYWLTDWPMNKVGSLSLYKMAKSRWEVENQGFNDGKNRYGMEHITHHHANSLLLTWLLTLLALVIERLFRLRYLHRGLHPPETPIQLLRRLRFSLGTPEPHNSA
jgi:hypothetical protein